MRKRQVVLWAVFTGWSLSVHCAELRIASFNIAWAGSEADFNEHIRVCSSPQVNWCDTRPTIAKGEEAPAPVEAKRANKCQSDFDTVAGGADKGLLVAPCNAYKLSASKWKKATPGIYAEKLDGLRQTVDGLIRTRGVDLIAFQEVRSADVIKNILGGYSADFDVCVADHTSFQSVGFAWRRSMTSKPGKCVLEASLAIKEDPKDSTSLRFLRPGVSLSLTIGKDPLTLMNVHLKSSCANLITTSAFKGHELTDSDAACRVLKRQVAPLEAWIDGVAKTSPLFVVLGDFNRRLDEEAAKVVPPNDVRKDHTDPATPNKTGPNGEVNSKFLWHELSDGDPTLIQVPPPVTTDCKGFEGLDHILISAALNARQTGQLSSEKIKVEQKDKQVIVTSDHCPRITKLNL